MNCFPSESLIDSTLRIGANYRLCAPELISTDIPHYFIVVAIDSDDIYTLLGTTKEGRVKSHFANNDLEPDGLVFIKADEKNGFTQDTWVNCNDIYTITRIRLESKVYFNELEYRGRVSYNHYDQLRTGIIGSCTADLPHDMLVHPDD